MTTAAVDTTYQLLPLTKLSPHPANPRKRFDAAKMKELETSVRQKGVLVPILVRKNGAGFEILAGERRSRAAKAAGLSDVPVIVRELSDAEAREIVVFENLEHEDLDPLEEADGYRTLMTQDRYTVARIAERLGCSEKYVYDRVKLLQLVPEAKTLLLSDRITAGHAILLARLKPEEQKRAIDPDSRGCFEAEDADLFTAEELHGVPQRRRKEKPDSYDGLKAVSVRELETWINDHVRFVPEATDLPMLFPETHQVLHAATDQEEKIVKITHEHYVQPETRDEKERTYGPRSWERADGKHRSKPCDSSVTGVIVAGVGRGEAFKVCIDKKKCAVHWAKEQRESKRRAVHGDARSMASQQERYKQEEAKRKEEQDKAEAERNRWKKATPAILKAIAEKVRKAPAGAKGFLADLVIKACTPRHYGVKVNRESLPRGTTAEDLVRHAAFFVLQDEAQDWRGLQEFPKLAKAIGVDARKILDEVAPTAKPETEPAKPVQTSAKKGKGGA